MSAGIAVIGLGVIGRRMLDQAGRREDLRIAAAWDLDERAMQAAARDYPGTPLASDARSAIEAPGVDIVYIGTPPGVHRQYVEMAIAAGRKVFCEKPLAVDLADGAAIVNALRESATPNAVNYVFASSPAVAELEARLRGGSIGAPVSGEIRIFFSRWPRDWQASAAWLAWRAEGGFVREVVSHYVYLLERLFGPVGIVSSMVDWPPDESLCERASLALLDCAGVPVRMMASAGGAGPDIIEFTVRGQSGALRLENWFELSLSDGSAWTRLEASGIGPGRPDPRTAAYQSQLDSLARMARGEAHRLPDAAVALSVQRTIEAILRN
jgi:predicted dehydrogenase